MNVINNLLSEIKFRIPLDVLQLTFRERQNYRNIVTSLDDKIMTEVIRKRLMVDLNLASQETINVALQSCQLLYHDTVKTAYFIPKELTGGRSIVSALSMMSGYHMHGDTMLSNHQLSGSSLLDNSISLMNSLDNVNIRQTARIDLIGENTVLIDMGMLDNLAVNLVVVVENDINLNNINPRAFGALSTLAVLIMKAYIYNTMVIRVNEGELYSGHEISVIKDIIYDYKDAEEQYQEYYETTWKKIAFMQNGHNMDKFITSMFGNQI